MKLEEDGDSWQRREVVMADSGRQIRKQKKTEDILPWEIGVNMEGQVSGNVIVVLGT